MDITLDMLTTEKPAQLREHMQYMAEYYAREYPLFRLGAGFARIKKEELWKRWGFSGIMNYAQSECPVKPRGACNFLPMLYRQFLSKGISHEEMERIERMRYQAVFLVWIAKHAENRQEIYDFLAHRTTKKTLQAISTLRAKNKDRWFTLGPYRLAGSEHFIVSHILSDVRRMLPKSQTTSVRALVVICLVYKAMKESQTYREASSTLAKLLFEHGIPEELATKIVGVGELR